MFTGLLEIVVATPGVLVSLIAQDVSTTKHSVALFTGKTECFRTLFETEFPTDHIPNQLD